MLARHALVEHIAFPKGVVIPYSQESLQVIKSLNVIMFCIHIGVQKHQLSTCTFEVRDNDIQIILVITKTSLLLNNDVFATVFLQGFLSFESTKLKGALTNSLMLIHLPKQKMQCH